MSMQKIIPNLWFDSQAEEAVKFYISLIENSSIGAIARYGDTGPGPKGSVMTIAFKLAGQDFLALNGGPMYTFSPAISFIINCKTQKEIDRLWEELSRGGEKQVCGWLRDKFGVSWQIVPEVLAEMMKDKDPERTNRVMEALLKMEKIDIKGLEKAYGGK
jgi:predicted 3-demethylubiquinone-9 3-methyltransferase (glyoxalase superfamily)